MRFLVTEKETIEITAEYEVDAEDEASAIESVQAGGEVCTDRFSDTIDVEYDVIELDKVEA